MGQTVTVIVDRELERRLDYFYGKPRTGLSEDVVFALRIARKRKTPLPDVFLVGSDTITIGIQLSQKNLVNITKLSPGQSRSASLRGLLNWMLTLKSVQKRQVKRVRTSGVTPTRLSDFDTMKTTLDSAGEGTLANSTIATAFMGISTKLAALAEHWGVDRDRALIMAIGYAHDKLKSESL